MMRWESHKKNPLEMAPDGQIHRQPMDPGFLPHDPLVPMNSSYSTRGSNGKPWVETKLRSHHQIEPILDGKADPEVQARPNLGNTESGPVVL